MIAMLIREGIQHFRSYNNKSPWPGLARQGWLKKMEGSLLVVEPGLGMAHRRPNGAK